MISVPATWMEFIIFSAAGAHMAHMIEQGRTRQGRGNAEGHHQSENPQGLSSPCCTERRSCTPGRR